MKLLNLMKNRWLFLFIFFIPLISCEEEKPAVPFAAKVNESVLSVNDLNSYLGSNKYGNKQRNEFIRQWIETEILFLEAAEKGLMQENEYEQILQISKKELAAALLLNNYFQENEPDVSGFELQRYFIENRDDFLFNDDACLLNMISFSNEDRAIEFRSKLYNLPWKRVLKEFEEDEFLISNVTEGFNFFYQIQPARVLRVVKSLNESEISIVIQEEPNKFSIVQPLRFFRKGETPEFVFIQDFIRDRYLISKRKEMFNDFMNDLYEKYNVTINKDFE